MRITPVFSIKNNLGIGLAASTLLLAPLSGKTNSNLNLVSPTDTFESVSKVTPEGTDEKSVLIMAPSPDVEIAGEIKKAAIVVDLSSNVLYKYDEFGNAVKAYLVASGKESSPTAVGVRMVTHVEVYPYKYAPAKSKRRRNPKDYGPKIICLETVNTKTGTKGTTGEFIHGNNNPESIGQYVSHGCIRMDNNVIIELSQEVKRGDIVIMKK